MSQNSAQAYEAGDFALLSLKFGTNSFVEVLKDSGKFDGCGSASSPVVYSGTRIDLPSADGVEANFISYYVQFDMPSDSNSFLLKFSTTGGSDNEDYWIDDINVEKILKGTCIVIR